MCKGVASGWGALATPPWSRPACQDLENAKNRVMAEAGGPYVEVDPGEGSQRKWEICAENWRDTNQKSILGLGFSGGFAL